MSKVSVIVPTYNNAQYICQAIESILNQTYRNFEIIVVDDGSTDNTAKILAPYKSKIRYFYQHNQGPAVARSTGILNAKGQYLSFLDADDYWKPQNLEIKEKILQRDPSLGAVFSNFFLFSNDAIISNNAIDRHYPIFRREKITIAQLFSHKELASTKDPNTFFTVYKGTIFEPLLFGNFINLCSILIRKDSQESVGLFRSDLRTQQDYEYWLRFSRQHKMAYVDLPLVAYRRHSTQLTAHKNIVKILRNVIQILSPYYFDLQKLDSNELHIRFLRRYSSVFASLGLAYLGIRENKRALEAFKQSHRIYNKNITSIFLRFFALLPPLLTHDYFKAFLVLRSRLYEQR